MELTELPLAQREEVVGAKLAERAAVDPSGAALRAVNLSVIACNAALYCSDGNGRLDRPCHALARSVTSCALDAGMLYSTIIVICSGLPNWSRMPNAKRPSPADPLLTFCRSMRLAIASRRNGARLRSSAPLAVRGNGLRIRSCIDGRAATVKPPTV